MRRSTLGTKLTLWSALIVTVALLASALISDIFVYRAERRELDRELNQAAHHFFDQHRAHGLKVDWVVDRRVEEVFFPRDPNRFVLIRSEDGRALYHSPNLPVGIELPTGSGMHNVRIGAARTRLGVFREHGVTLYLAGDTAEITDLILKLAIGNLVALPFMLAVVALGGWWLGRQALEPLRAMADAAEDVQPEELSRRLPEPSQDDEIGRLARVFNELLDRLERGFHQATRFSTDASHELRTPLAVLRGSIEELLDDPALGDAQRDAVAELQFQTQRLISITNTLLLLARADAGRLKLKLEDADLRDLMLDCFEDAKILGEQHGVRVECHFDEPGPVRVEPLRIRQALLNLLDNAVKYNVPDGKAVMTLAVENGWCRVRVGNSGPEIPAADRKALFERFFRAGQQEDRPGSGLGLSLARELARGHSGDIVLLGSENGWTEFELSLPTRVGKSGSPRIH